MSNGQAPAPDLSHITKDLQPLAVAMDTIRPDPNNAQTGHDTDRIAQSLAQYGQRKPIVVNRSQDNKIEAGNGTYAAAQLLGWAHIAAVFVEDDPATAAGYGIADNRVADFSKWDLGTLGAVADTLPDNIFTGFKTGELSDLLGTIKAGPAEKNGTGKRLDQVPDLVLKWSTKPGQLWEIPSAQRPGMSHFIYCGDCTNDQHVARLFDGQRPALLMTDPPYCSGGYQEASRPVGGVGTRSGEMIANDTLSTRGYISLIRRMLQASGAAVAYIFTDWRMWVNLFDTVESCGMGVRAMIVWDKKTPGMGTGWRMQHELIMYAVKAKNPIATKKAHANVIQADRTGNKNHATEKPTELLAQLQIPNPAGLQLYDPMMGSGSAIVAAERYGRQSYGMELTPGYTAIALDRLAGLGLDPQLRAQHD